MKKGLIIFDFDGVIVNSLDFSFEINKRDDDSLTRKEWQLMHLGNIYKNREKSKIKSTVEDFYLEYEKQIHDIPPIEGMSKTISSLHTRYQLALISGSPAKIIREYLKRHNLSYAFDEVIGYEDGTKKHEKIEGYLRKSDIHPANCVQVTDTIGDIKEGLLAGVVSIPVTWGVFEKEHFLNEKVFGIAESSSGIVELVDQYFALAKTGQDQTINIPSP